MNLHSTNIGKLDLYTAPITTETSKSITQVASRFKKKRKRVSNIQDWEIKPRKRINVSTVQQDRRDLLWSRHYMALIEYFNEHGTYNAPKTCTYECTLVGMGDNDGKDYHYKDNLGEWLYRQKLGKKKKGSTSLRPDKEAQLQILVNEGKRS